MKNFTGAGETDRKSTEEKIRNLEVMVASLNELITEQEKVVSEQFEEIQQEEEALSESRERYRSLVETISDWVWEVDENGVYTYSNPRVFDQLGYTPDEIVGKTPFDFMLPEEVARVGEIFGRIIESRKSFSSLENAARHRDGHTVILETGGVPLFDQNGEFTGYRGIDRDITERKLAEEALRESNERFIIFIKEAAMRLKNPMEVIEENISLIIGEIEKGSFEGPEILLQLRIQLKNMEQIRQNIIELNKAIVDRSGDFSEASRQFLTE